MPCTSSGQRSPHTGHWVTEPRGMRSAEGCAQPACTTTHCCRLSDQPTDCQNAPTGRREACCAAWPVGTTGGCARRTVDLSGLRTCSICTASVARTHALWCRSTCGAVAQWRMERSVTCGALPRAACLPTGAHHSRSRPCESYSRPTSSNPCVISCLMTRDTPCNPNRKDRTDSGYTTVAATIV